MTRHEKIMTLRLQDALADDLDIIATVDDETRSGVIRAAIAAHVAARKADPTFQARARTLATQLAEYAS